MKHERTREHHAPPGRLRRIVGWIAVVAGIAMVVLPGPGLLSIALGIVLLGRREPTLRRWSVTLRHTLRRMSRARQRRIGALGWFLRHRYRESRRFIREQVHRHAHGQPFSPVVRLLIGIALLATLITVGAGAAMLFNG
jgi:ABC-type Fe3+ transport system permease subunit